MAAILPISTILQIAKICQYLSANDTAAMNVFQGGTIRNRYPRMVYMERKAVQNRYNLNPSDPTLISTGNYLFSILGSYAIQAQNILNALGGTKPVITGPTSQSVNVGSNATFTISVTSSTSITIQWYLGASLIPGATGLTYTVINAQLAQSGGQYSAIVTNSAGQITSASATLTVTQTITGYLYYNAADPGPTLRASSDPFTYQNNYAITHNSPISVTLPSGAALNQYLVFKIPSTENAKTTWYNTELNNGTIPDSVMQTAVTFGGFTYYYTRTQVSMNIAEPFILS